jgi:MOSC domain-containing protein YiiM
MPCYLFDVRFGRSDIIKKFLASGRTGFYFSVEREVVAGEDVERIERDGRNVSVADVTRLHARQERLRGDAARRLGRGPARELGRPF